MISVQRAVAAALGAGLLVTGAISAAGPAAAQDAPPPAPQGGATATLGELRTYDKAVVRAADGTTKEVGAGLFEMAVDHGGSIQTYCVDFGTPAQPQTKYQEVPWSSSSLQNNPRAGKIRWILEHSYPQVNDLDALAAKAGAGKLSERTAAAGTQVAIWRLSDKATARAKDRAAEKLADYLTARARNAGGEPKASLSLSPATVAGRTGERVGPVTVRTNAGGVNLAPAPAGAASGVRVVDADGRQVTSAADGTKLWFDVPEGTEDGASALTAQASTKVPVGRVFTGVGAGARSQTQILAGSSTATVSATATATWSAGGPAAAVTARKNCAEGGVDVTAVNRGDADFTFRVAGKRHTVAPGAAETVTVPVGEDQAYRIAVTGTGGFERTFSGVLDCATAEPPDGGITTQTGPATTGGAPVGAESGDLAETGSSNATPVIAGVAIGLVVVGGAIVLLLRRRGGAGGDEG
ncbi:Cys-Gln thioester bond-forming surface protein [Streptomyces sp. A7024]|uniref:Cys-Gln thioester bond-forming surface protein n=1 Tax=Streptomyces coryli TaxID=1128680 RepID=A0A6G4U713_9ACTN|nr:Cys-Gln thioester bond-forming surface protein [Streptomyces coryli]NGN68029.1 Cys-Gln thioester bond-forming surface protein [Streptomyces coryli]